MQVFSFIFLVPAYEVSWPVLSLAISSSHQLCIVSVPNTAEMARRCRTN